MKLDSCFSVSVLVDVGIKALYLGRLKHVDMNNKKECPSCAMPVDIDEEICPICGYEFPEETMLLKLGVWLLIVLMLLWVLF